MSAPKNKKYLQDGDHQSEGKFKRNVFETLVLGYKPFKGRIFLCIGLGFIGRLLLLANTNIIGFWVDSYCKAPAQCRPIPHFFNGYMAEDFVKLLLGMSLIGFIFIIFFRVIFSRLSAEAVSRIYDEVTLRTSRYPMSFFDQTPAGRIITRFSSDYGNVFRLFGGPLAEFLSIVFDLILMVVLITVANPIYLIFVSLVVFLNFLVYRANQEHLRKVRRELSASRSPSIAHFAETTQGASTIRSFRRQKSFKERFDFLDQYFLSQKLKTTFHLVGFSIQMNSLSVLLLLITGISAFYLAKAGTVSIGSVGVAFSFITLSGNTVQMFFEWLAQLEEAMIGVERLDNYLRKPIENGNHLPSSTQFNSGHPVYSKATEEKVNSQKLTEEKSASVKIQDLWFRYRDDLPWVLKNLNCEIKAGERLGIVGRTGSGKTSLIQTIFHLYPIQKGQIQIGGHTPTLDESGGDVDLNLYRRSIAFIAQEPILFQGTLKSNLDIEQKYSQEQLYSVLDQVGLKEWVQQSSQQLNMKIEEKGKNLSLGERQLICMARCLLQEAPVVIMDEATSSVDPQSEEIMVRATEEFFKERTQIIIAHRLSTLEKCDRILWLKNGEAYRLGPAKDILHEFENEEA